MVIPIPSPLEPPILRRSTVQPPPNSGPISPNVSQNQLQLIGAVAVAWAKLENALNDLTWTVQSRRLGDGRAETEDLQITKLLTALKNAMQKHLSGLQFAQERKSIHNLISFVSKTKHERNIVIHGTWASLGSMPIVGSLRVETPDPSLVTFEHYPQERMESIEQYALSATNNAKKLTLRLESLLEIPPLQPPQG